MSKYLIAAGGTSGHINPAIAIADEIKRQEPEAVIVFCGTKKGLENTVVPKNHYDLIHIDAAGFPKKLSMQLVHAVIAYFKGRRQSRDYIRKFSPDAVIGTGGYVCGPMVSMAAAMGIPTLIHEQNAFPGKANRFLSKKAEVVCISFPNTESAFPKAKKIVMTGNPVRREFYGLTRAQAREALGFDANEKILFATGGSLGARSINQAVMGLLKQNPKPGFKIILACGKTSYPDLKEEAERYPDVLQLKEYLFDQHLYLAAADVVLCRAGALTCSEIAMLGKASVMVPYPYAAGDHQTFNARAFSDIGASVLIEDRSLEPALLQKELENLFRDPSKLTQMEKNALSLALPDATRMIYSELKEIMNRKTKL